MNGMDLAALVHTLAWTLLHFIWQGCVLAAAFALMTLTLRRAQPACRYLAGCLTLLMMALAPLATFSWLWSHTDRTVERMMFAAGTTPGAILALPSSGLNQNLLYVVIVWLLGAAACVVWVIGGWLQTRRLGRIDAVSPSHRVQSMIDGLSRRLGVTAVLRIVDHAAIVVPMTLGVVKPIIFIPASTLLNLSPAHLEAIIAHEMAHVRRLDYVVNLLQALLEAILFYHPAVWWVSRHVRHEREFCCDDVAAEVCGNRITYARALAELESLRGDSFGGRLGLSSQGGSLMKRIVRLVGQELAGQDRGAAVIRSDRRSRLAAALAGVALLSAASATFALVQTSPPALQVEAEAGVAGQVALQLQEVLADEALVEVTPDMQWILMPDQGADEAEAESALQAVQLSRVYTQVDLEPVLEHVHAVRVSVASGVRLPIWYMLDPAKMPSDGLVRAAQYAYPFDLFTLTPWVDPNAHEVLVLPQVEAVAGEQSDPADQSSDDVLLHGGWRLIRRQADIAPARRVAVEHAMVDLQLELVPTVVETSVIIRTVEGVRANPPAAEPVPAVEEPAPAPPAEEPAPQPSPPKP